jgi:hypothetical protein
MISVGFNRITKKGRVGFAAKHLLWLFEGRRYFNQHAQIRHTEVGKSRLPLSIEVDDAKERTFKTVKS